MRVLARRDAHSVLNHISSAKARIKCQKLGCQGIITAEFVSLKHQEMGDSSVHLERPCINWHRKEGGNLRCERDDFSFCAFEIAISCASFH